MKVERLEFQGVSFGGQLWSSRVTASMACAAWTDLHKLRTESLQPRGRQRRKHGRGLRLRVGLCEHVRCSGGQEDVLFDCSAFVDGHALVLRVMPHMRLLPTEILGTRKRA